MIAMPATPTRYVGAATAGTTRPLLVALAGSLALHASVVAWFAGGGGDGTPRVGSASSLEALLVVVPQAPANVLTSTAPAPVALPPPPEIAAIPVPAPRTARAAGSARGGSLGPLLADASPVTDRSRLGPYLDRELAEFPAEIDSPPRLAQQVTVAFPAGATPASASEVVTIWAIVKPDGTADDILVATGSGAFAEATVLALRDARFVPARKNAQAIAYPLSLEFRFTPAETPPTTNEKVAGRR